MAFIARKARSSRYRRPLCGDRVGLCGAGPLYAFFIAATLETWRPLIFGADYAVGTASFIHGLRGRLDTDLRGRPTAIMCPPAIPASS